MASVEAALGLIQPCGEPEVNFMLFGCSIPLCTALSTQPDFAHHRSGLTSGEKEVAEPICVQDDGGKVVKKPDKLLACPRCSSLDTKFCYFNNCNVSQPRHFCKRCQRYWTSGGTMRDVPVGSGRRKGKHSSAFSHPRFRNTARSDALVESTLQLPQQGTARHLKMGGCSVQEFCSVPPSTSPSDAIPVLSYGKEAETGLASDERNATSEKKKLASSSSSVGTQIFSSKQPPVTEQPFSAAEFFMGGYPFSFPMGLWPYGYGPFPAPVSPMIPHAFAIPPWPLMPIPPWGPPPAQNAPPFREGGAEEGFPLTLKTLRIHHPAEAAQSSIWSALGLDYKSDFPASAGAIFDAFPLKAVVAVTEEPPTVDAICSNPAAVTRSMAFHEGS